MGTFIFLTAVFIEIAFAVYCIITKSNQQKVRSIIRILVFAGFTVLAILPVIDWGLRYYALGTLLFMLAVMGGVAIMRKREEERGYKAVHVVLKGIGMTLLIFVVSQKYTGKLSPDSLFSWWIRR